MRGFGKLEEVLRLKNESKWRLKQNEIEIKQNQVR